ncbi:wall-associated receptor kinase-like 10 [Cynara cardunculus var. scolymus]|uniref:wall-associated receptor kinase-like 10 n=1 Tax=Cynara cardunculus var. scolymus TaxID=59895 RepID=UPI000D62F612|nr:wall-associated receptor kinase-like 10 [Cynara cardunculus var. scolymus]
MDYKDSPYTLSDVNKFIVIGCDDSAWLISQTNSRNVSTGCMVFCSTPEDVVGDQCSGNGCCQSSIPKDINYYETDLNSLVDSKNTMSFNPCTYAFVGEENAYTFNGLTSLNDTDLAEKIEASVPIVLEWAIGNLSCIEAKAMDGFACQYSNNINECRYPEMFNIVGSYTCKCKGGYSGDAKIRDGCRGHKPFLLVVLLSIEKKFTPPVNTCAGALLGILVLIFSLWLLKVVQRRKLKNLKEKFFKRNGGLLLQQQMSSGERMVDHQINATELEKATGQFNEDRIVGRGGQGIVFKRMLADGRIVAVKKSMLVDESQVETFISEVFILSQIIHKHVVKLLGCCLETEVPMLVYEFVGNGTLFDFIHDENYEFPTLWKLRLQISIEIAGALAYLHSTTFAPIYHRDIKSSNILLDDKFRAKISDFGISKSLSGDQTHLSSLVKGTMGYLDPEYFQSSHLTEKSDVYSFGVVLLDLLTGKIPIFRTPYGERMSLATFILSMEDEQLVENVDDRVLDAPKEQLIAVVNIAKRCLNLKGVLRPNMKDVATDLEGIRLHNQSQQQSNDNS